MKDPFEAIRARMKLLEEPLRAQRELSRQLGSTHFAAQTLERLETFRAMQAYEQERTASRLAAADFDAFGISKTYEEMERRHQALRLASETFDRLGSEEAARLRFLQDIRLFDGTIFEQASLASEEVARMRDLFDRTAARAPLWQDALTAAEMAKELALPDRRPRRSGNGQPPSARQLGNPLCWCSWGAEFPRQRRPWKRGRHRLVRWPVLRKPLVRSAQAASTGSSPGWRSCQIAADRVLSVRSPWSRPCRRGR